MSATTSLRSGCRPAHAAAIDWIKLMSSGRARHLVACGGAGPARARLHALLVGRVGLPDVEVCEVFVDVGRVQTKVFALLVGGAIEQLRQELEALDRRVVVPGLLERVSDA